MFKLLFALSLISTSALADHSVFNCKYKLVVKAEKYFDDYWDAVKACENWGDQYCKIDTSKDYEFLAIFVRDKILEGEGRKRHEAFLSIFPKLGKFLLSGKFDLPIFTHSGRLVECKKRRPGHGGGY